jgi:hypothetical protein
MILSKIEPYFYIFIALVILSCIYLIIRTSRLADIKISDGILIVDILSKERKINLADLEIYDISIVQQPLFLMKTSVGNFEIDYTNDNYEQILELLRITNFRKLEEFKRKAENYNIHIFERVKKKDDKLPIIVSFIITGSIVSIFFLFFFFVLPRLR